MLRNIAVVVVFATIAASQAPALQVDAAATTLARARAAYYQARFNDTIDMLAPLDAALDGEADRIQDRIRVKLQLALAHIGLNQSTEARARFSEIYELNPQFALDPAQFAPKVLTLFEEGKTALGETTCRTVCARVDRALSSSNADTILKSLEGEPACSCMVSKNLQAAEIIYADALKAYKRGEQDQALSKLHAVLKLNPEHDLAAQYVDLIDNKVKLSLDRVALEWRSQFDARDFARATESYRQLVSLNLEDKAASVLSGIRTEYRKALIGVAQSWNQACQAQDQPAMDRLRAQANELLPDSAMGRDILDQMNNCAVKTPPPPLPVTRTPAPAAPSAAPPAPAPEPTDACLKAVSTNAMVRLKTLVNPVISSDSRRNGAVRVRARVKIDKSGNTEVQELLGGSALVNGAVQAAVEKWKFYPAIVNGQPRCVETELPIVLDR